MLASSMSTQAALHDPVHDRARMDPAAEPWVPVFLLELGAGDGGGGAQFSSIVIRELLVRLAVKIVTAVANARIDQPDGVLPNSLIFQLPFNEY